MQQNGMKAYRDIGIATEVMSATPHRLIQILLEEVIKQLGLAKQAIEKKHIANRLKHITKAQELVIALRASLNTNVEGDISKNLSSLYDFITWHLVDANREGSIRHIEEVEKLIHTIKEGWDAIGPDNNSQQNQK